MKHTFRAFVVICALLGAYLIGTRAVAEYRTFRAQQAQTAAMFEFLSATVGTRKDETGKDVPLSRADGLAAILNDVLKAAAAPK
jgi:hypothetical protein